jgi:hypothetical protein
MKIDIADQYIFLEESRYIFLGERSIHFFDRDRYIIGADPQAIHRSAGLPHASCRWALRASLVPLRCLLVGAPIRKSYTSLIAIFLARAAQGFPLTG